MPPDPGALIESMRAFGYSLPSAIADLVDNSVSASAGLIGVNLRWAGDASWIEVIDDGHGMSPEELTNAMRLGSRSPREERVPTDLGRFGLGLKTAAFSQATRLTVASRRAGDEAAARCWDLPHVIRTGRWDLLLLAPSDTATPSVTLEGLESGTLVILGGLDRLVGGTEVDDDAAKLHFLHHAEAVERHLGMVFHRFLANGLEIRVNGHAVEAWDPFMKGVGHVQRLPEESLRLDGRRVQVAPHVLPHYSNLSADAHRRAAGPRGWNQHQGFYVYRARRLLVAGDWLGLPVQKEEHYKLARIRVDLDNAMDAAWQIDVRKATARIPRQLVTEMRRIADATRRRAALAYRYRGKRLARTASRHQAFVWTARIHDGTVSYRIDRGHPVIADALADDAPRVSVERALRLVEETIPIASIVMDSRDHPDAARAPFEGRGGEVDRMLRAAFAAMTDHGAQAQAAIELLAAREPFDSHPELVAALAEEVAP